MEITTRIGCKNNCAYCPQAKLIKAYQKRGGDFIMSLETFKKCIDKLPQGVVIEFSGMSEPWLNPDCTEMILYAHNKGHRIRVFTTLIGLDLDNFEKIRHIPFENFWIHLPCDGDSENINVNDAYLEVLLEVYNFLEENKDKINVSYHIRGAGPHPKIKELLGNKIEKRAIGSRANNLDEDIVKNSKKRLGKIGCKRYFQQNVLLPNGDVILCCMDYGMEHILGNLLHQNYYDILSGDEIKNIHQAVNSFSDQSICRYCDMLAVNKSRFAKIYNPIRSNGLKAILKKLK